MEKGVYTLRGVASRSAACSGGIGIDRRMVFSRRRRLLGWRGAGEALRGPEPVVAYVGLTEGKEGRSSEPRTKAWSRVGDGDNDGVVYAALDHRRPGLGRLCRLKNNNLSPQASCNLLTHATAMSRSTLPAARSAGRGGTRKCCACDLPNVARATVATP